MQTTLIPILAILCIVLFCVVIVKWSWSDYYKEQVKSLESDILNKDSFVDSLIDDIKKLNNDITLYQNSNTMLLDSLSEEKQEKQDLFEDTKELKQRLLNSLNSNERLTKLNTQYNADNLKLKEENKIVLNDNLNKDKELRTANARVDILSNEVSRLQALIESHSVIEIPSSNITSKSSKRIQKVTVVNDIITTDALIKEVTSLNNYPYPNEKGIVYVSQGGIVSDKPTETIIKQSTKRKKKNDTSI